MPSNDLTFSTSNQTAFSVGPSGIDFTTLCGQSLPIHSFETSSLFPGFSLFMETQSATGQSDYWISLKIPGTSGGVELAKTFRTGFYVSAS